VETQPAAGVGGARRGCTSPDGRLERACGAARSRRPAGRGQSTMSVSLCARSERGVDGQLYLSACVIPRRFGQAGQTSTCVSELVRSHTAQAPWGHARRCSGQPDCSWARAPASLRVGAALRRPRALHVWLWPAHVPRPCGRGRPCFLGAPHGEVGTVAGKTHGLAVAFGGAACCASRGVARRARRHICPEHGLRQDG